MKKKLIYTAIVVFLLLGGWSIYQYASITYIGETSEPSEADVIIILGAGVWPHGPSPALSARTLQAAEIYERWLAENLILSGGLGQYPPTEAEAMQEILLDLDIDPKVMVLDKQAKNTEENIKYSKQIMEEHGWQRAIIVTDPFHLKRALLLAQNYEIEASGAPVKNSVLYTNKALKLKYTLREIAAITHYYFKKWL